MLLPLLLALLIPQQVIDFAVAQRHGAAFAVVVVVRAGSVAGGAAVRVGAEGARGATVEREVGHGQSAARAGTVGALVAGASVARVQRLVRVVHPELRPGCCDGRGRGANAAAAAAAASAAACRREPSKVLTLLGYDGCCRHSIHRSGLCFCLCGTRCCGFPSRFNRSYVTTLFFFSLQRMNEKTETKREKQNHRASFAPLKITRM